MLAVISVIISAFNSERTIGKCLTSIYQINYPQEDLEIIVINDGSNDRTQEIIEAYPAKVVNTQRLGPAGARNLAVKVAKGEFVAFTDADCIVHREWLIELLKGFNNDEKIVAVGGSQRSPDDEVEFGKDVQRFLETMSFIGGYTKRFKNIIEVSHNPACNVIYRKDIFEKLGGFSKGLWPGEDVDLDYRMTKEGYKIVYNPKAVVYHYRPDCIRAFLKMMRTYGCWAGGYLLKKYGFFRKLYYEPFLLTFFVLLQITLILYNPQVGLTVFLIFLILPFLYFVLRFPEPKKAFRQYLLFFLTLIYWNLGFLEGLRKD